MFRYRIVIRAFTRKRDISSASLISSLLQKMGHQVMITCTRDFNSVLRYWKPHLVLVNTFGASLKAKKVDPNVKSIFIDGESFFTESNPAAHYFKNLEAYNAMDEIFVWGEKMKKMINKNSKNSKNKPINVVGYPVLDLIKFAPKIEVKSKTIGFVMRQSLINNYKWDNAIKNIPFYDHLDRTLVQVKSFYWLIKCINQVLNKTNFKVSLRPHPREKTRTYIDNIEHWFGKENAHRVEIDDSSVFIDWVKKQKSITTPTSTSIVEAYLLRVPIINMSEIAGINVLYDHQDEMENECQKTGYMPKNMNEYLNLIKNNVVVNRNKKLDKLLQTLCTFHAKNNYSSCLEIAKRVDNFLKKEKTFRFPLIPKIILELKDALTYKMLKTKNEAYPDFNFYKGIHEGPKNLESITKDILDKDKMIYS